MAVLLVLLLDGLWAGVRSQVTRYEDAVGAQLYVVASRTVTNAASRALRCEFMPGRWS